MKLELHIKQSFIYFSCGWCPHDPFKLFEIRFIELLGEPRIDFIEILSLQIGKFIISAGIDMYE